MKPEISYDESEFSLEDLEQFRDENGFIDLDRAGVELTQESREKIGTEDRIKNWVNFNGTKALIKGATQLDDTENYMIYAELIVEEIAKQLGLPAAHYDLIKIDGKLGVLSVSVVQDTEDLISLHDIIGDEKEETTPYPDVTGFDFTINELTQKMKDNGYSREEIRQFITDYRKLTIFSLAVLDQDKHTENISIIREKNGQKLRIAPIFDSEHALLLDSDVETVHKLINGDYSALKGVVEIAHPRIGNFRSRKVDGYECLWADTLESVYEEPQVPIDNDDPYFDDSFDTAYDFCDRLCREDFGEIIDRAFAAVEERIHAKLPEEAKQIAKYAFLARQTDLGEVLRGERQRPGDRNKATGTIEEENIFAQLQSLIGDITITEQRECVDEIVETYKENLEHDKDHEDKDEK